MQDQVKTKWEQAPSVILLDLGGVVFAATGSSNPVIDWAEVSRLNYKYGHALNIGKDCFGDFLRDYNSATQQSLDGSTFLEEIFNTLEFNQALVSNLSTYGPIFIVSDNYRENIAYISRRYHFEAWAERQYYSFDFQEIKGNPLFFARLRNALPKHLRPVLVDDSREKIISARRNGIPGIQYRENEAAFADIRSYLQVEYLSNGLKCGIRLFGVTQKTELLAMLKTYLMELNSSYDTYPYFDAYWEEENRIPLGVYSDDQLAGFILLNKYTIQAVAEWSVAELYIAPSFRRQNLAQTAVSIIFDLLPAIWEVAVQAKNQAGQAFWSYMLKDYVQSRNQQLRHTQDDQGEKILYLLLG